MRIERLVGADERGHANLRSRGCDATELPQNAILDPAFTNAPPRARSRVILTCLLHWGGIAGRELQYFFQVFVFRSH
jgi:hypothetical protein